MAVHLYDNNSRVYNFLFHPLHDKQKEIRAVSVITVIFLTIVTGGLWQIPFWVINRIDNQKLKSLDGQDFSKTTDVARRRFSEDKSEKNSFDEGFVSENEVDNHSQEEMTKELQPFFQAGAIWQQESPVLEPLPKVEICTEIKKTLDLLFVDSPYSIDTLPIFPRILGNIWAERPLARSEMEQPIMKGVDANGIPFIAIKIDREHEEEIIILSQFFVKNPLDWGQVNIWPDFIRAPFTNPESGEVDPYSKSYFDEVRSLIVNGYGKDKSWHTWKLGK